LSTKQPSDSLLIEVTSVYCAVRTGILKTELLFVLKDLKHIKYIF